MPLSRVSKLWRQVCMLIYACRCLDVASWLHKSSHLKTWRWWCLCLLFWVFFTRNFCPIRRGTGMSMGVTERVRNHFIFTRAVFTRRRKENVFACFIYFCTYQEVRTNVFKSRRLFTIFFFLICESFCFSSVTHSDWCGLSIKFYDTSIATTLFLSSYF